MKKTLKIFDPIGNKLNEIIQILKDSEIEHELTNNYFDYKLFFEDLPDNLAINIQETLGDSLYTDEDISLIEFFHKKIYGTSFTLSGAESCTGGLISKLLTDQPGSSKYFKHSLVTYANDSKEDILNVSKETLEEAGAVSKRTVVEMLDGLLYIKMTNLVYAISGIAGPSGGTETTPVGTVFIGVMRNGIRDVEKYHFTGDRITVRNKATQQTIWNLYRIF